MFKIILSIVLSVCFTLQASATSAFPFLKANRKNNVKQMMAVKKEANFQDSKHTDFTGHWSGTCSDDSEVMTFNLEQYGDYIAIMDGDEFGDSFDIGRVISDSSSKDNMNDFEHMFIHWNTEGNELNFDTTHVDTNSTQMFTYLEHTVMSLQNNQLVVRSESQSFENLQSHESGTSSCTFSRVNDTNQVK